MVMVIGIDPGHGGVDHGACANGIIEAWWNMSFARLLKTRILKSVEPFDPILLREKDDETIDLVRRGKLSQEKYCQLVLSIHVNSMGTKPHWRGLLAFHWPGSSVGRRIGNAIMRAAPRPLWKPGWVSMSANDTHGSWIQHPRNVLGVHACPTVLVEVGYCSNVNDAEALKDDAVKSGLVAACMVGLAEFRYLKENP